MTHPFVCTQPIQTGSEKKTPACVYQTVTLNKCECCQQRWDSPLISRQFGITLKEKPLRSCCAVRSQCYVQCIPPVILLFFWQCCTDTGQPDRVSEQRLRGSEPFHHSETFGTQKCPDLKGRFTKTT